MLCGVAGPHESDPGRDPPGRARVPLASPSHIRRQQPQHRARAARAPWGLMGSMSFVVIEDTASPVTPVVCPRESRQTGCNGANPFSILRRQAPRFSAPAPPGWSTWKLVTRLWPSPSPRRRYRNAARPHAEVVSSNRQDLGGHGPARFPSGPAYSPRPSRFARE